jgi:hypothetical protein
LGPAWLDTNCDGQASVTDVLLITTRALGQPLGAAIDADADQCPDACTTAVTAYTPSVARGWMELLLNAIRIDTPRPVVHARNLFHLSAAMWDAWAAWEPSAAEWMTDEVGGAVADVTAARNEAISHAAYRVLMHRFAASPGAGVSLPSFTQRMADLGYDPSNTTLLGDSPAAIGNRIGAAIVAIGNADGSNESANYADNSGYLPVNPPLVVYGSGVDMVDPNRWAPLTIGAVPGPSQKFLAPHWGEAMPFCLVKSGPEVCHLDPGPPPQLGGATDAEFKEEIVEVIRFSSYLDPDDGVSIDISPGTLGKNSLGFNDGTGHAINPWTAQPYAPMVVKRGDWGRALAEFWADGPSSETPPGHWNTLAIQVAEHPFATRRFAGLGPSLDSLEWDVKLFFALNGGLHDAAVAAWDVKEFYDSVRPISQVRYMASKGQSSDPMGPAYHPMGLPLEDGLIELITAETTAAGARHEHLAGHEGEIAIYAWLGYPANPATDHSGAGWILGVDWLPYQRANFVTPPFAGYISGHSTFSRAAAEILTRLTGSPFWPGGLGKHAVQQNALLVFEEGPTESFELQWGTYYDASDSSGISRIYGGIHVQADDEMGRKVGSTIGDMAFSEAVKFFTGGTN